MPRQSCLGRTGEIRAGRLLRNIQEAFHLCGRKNEKFPLDFMKIKRMEAAAELLVSEPQLSICEVAEAAGYENQSKFSAAFKSIMGVTPFAYRCKSW